MPESWKTLESEVLLDRWWMTIRENRVELPDGHVLPEFHVIDYPDWALAMCMTEERELVLVEQYRYGIDQVCMEFPAGIKKVDESAQRAAERELMEETGFKASNWTSLGRYAPEPSKHTNWAYLFLAMDAKQVAEPSPDATEHLNVHRLPLAEVSNLIEEGTFSHAIHLTAYYRALHKGLISVDRDGSAV